MSNRIPIGSPVRTAAIVNRYLVKAKKNLGQNFLIDQNVIQEIIAASKIGQGDQVIEIGPGIGSLTEQLLLHGAKVFAYEVDQDLPEILQNELPKEIDGKSLSDCFKLCMKDVLKADFHQDIGDFFDFNQEIKVVANLPYYITTPIIFSLAESDLDFASLTLMMQKEVADRLVASPNSKDYGPLTIATQTQMQAKVALEVNHNSFMPAPKVDSSVVVLTPLINKPEINDQAKFNKIVKACFAQRRKTLNNNLKPLIKDTEKRKQVFIDLKIDPKVRPENLTIKQFIALADTIASCD